MGGMRSKKSWIRMILQSKVERSNLKTLPDDKSKVRNNYFMKSQKVRGYIYAIGRVEGKVIFTSRSDEFLK